MHRRNCLQQRIGQLAARQHGLVSRAQLLEIGMPVDTIRSWVRAKRLLVVQRGVYQVGPLAAPRAREMAALLACGPGSAISHWSGAGLWEVWKDRSSGAPVDVTVTHADRGRRPGVRVHRARRLPPDEVTELDGIAVTSLARTLLDLAGVASSNELSRMFTAATRAHDGLHADLPALLQRYPGRAGVPLLRRLRAEEAPALTRSEAEEQLLRLIRKSGLPRPDVNAHVDQFEVDFLWRTPRLIVEVDGFAFHSSRDRFENDRRRDALLAARGFRVIRLTWRQITAEPEATLLRVAQALWTSSPGVQHG